MPPVLEFEGIAKEYSAALSSRRVRALDGFSLKVERGEIFGFLGLNGAGKSTAIHIAMGFVRPSAGRGAMLGKAFGDVPTRKRVGFLAENVALYHRPAGKLVRFYGALNGLHGSELNSRSRETIEAVGLSDASQRNVGKFSRGMLQRAGLAQALVNDPELLILDEPTSALDPLGRVAIRELLLKQRERGKTIFLSSHLLSEVEMICDRVAILHRGRVAHIGNTRELLTSFDRVEIVARGSQMPASATPIGNDSLFRMEVDAAEQRPTIESLWTQGSQLISVNPKRRTLEEIFVELTGDAPNGGTR